MLFHSHSLILKLLLVILQVVDISRDDYEPSNEDITYADGINSSNGIASIDLQLPCGGSSLDEHEQQQTISRLVDACVVIVLKFCKIWKYTFVCYRFNRSTSIHIIWEKKGNKQYLGLVFQVLR